jgi:hypothetical protein
MMKTTALLAIVLGLSLAARSATATTWLGAGGNSCQPGTHQDVTYSVYGGNGLTASANFDVIAICPLALGETAAYPQSISDVYVYYKDNNSHELTFYCFASQTLDDGSIYYSGNKYTCSTAGGCSTAANYAYTGVNYLSWTSTELGSNLSNLYVDGNYFVYCNIPAVDGGAYSSIISYLAQY